MTLFVRTFQPSDQAAIADVCYQTGYMGESMLGQFHDSALFAVLFAKPYLLYSPSTCWVAVVESEIVGYCLTVADTQSYQQWHRKVHRLMVVRHIAKSTLWRSPTDIKRVLRWDTAPKLKAPPDLMNMYPAHFHINVSQKYQHRGIGRALMTSAIEHFKAQKTPGIHLRTTSRNTSALTFYKKLGFTTLAVADSTMWRLPGVQAILMGRKL